MAGCGVPVRRDWGLKCPECYGTLSSNTQPWLWLSSPLQYITRPADRSQMGPPRPPPHIPACPALPPPEIKAGFPQSILMSRLSVLLHVNIQHSRKSQYSGYFRWTCSAQQRLFKYCFTDILSAVKLKQVERFYLYAGLEICGRISQHNMGRDWLIFSLWLQGSMKTVNLLESPAGLWWL